MKLDLATLKAWTNRGYAFFRFHLQPAQNVNIASALQCKEEACEVVKNWGGKTQRINAVQYASMSKHK